MAITFDVYILSFQFRFQLKAVQVGKVYVEQEMVGQLTFDADMKLTGATLNYSKDGATVNITVSYGYAAQEISIPASGSTAEA